MKLMTRSGRSGRGIVPLGAVLLGGLLLVASGCATSNPELRHRGSIAYNRGNYVESRDRYAQAVDQRPQDFEAQIGLGRAYLALERPRHAQHALEKARVLVEDKPEVREQVLDLLAEALYRQERHDRLHAFLADAADQYGTVRDFLRQGEYLEKLGDVDGAEAAYRKAGYFAPWGEVEPYLAQASFYDSINDEPNAVQALRHAYYVDRTNREVAERLRDHGVVPGPTVAERPPKSEMIEEE